MNGTLMWEVLCAATLISLETLPKCWDAISFILFEICSQFSITCIFWISVADCHQPEADSLHEYNVNGQMKESVAGMC